MPSASVRSACSTPRKRARGTVACERLLVGRRSRRDVHRAVSLLAFVLSLLSISCGKDDQALDRLPGRQGFLRLSDADRRAFSAFNAGKAAQIFARTS